MNKFRKWQKFTDRPWIILNVLSDDINFLRSDANDYDFINVSESINNTKETLQVLIDNVISLEYMLYLFEKEGS